MENRSLLTVEEARSILRVGRNVMYTLIKTRHPACESGTTNSDSFKRVGDLDKEQHNRFLKRALLSVICRRSALLLSLCSICLLSRILKN